MFRRRRVGIGGFGQTAEHLEVGDERIHLGQVRGNAIEGTDCRFLPVSLGDT
ncbi:hypothetical protein D3C86_1986140 [compost metagenome]